MKLLFYINLFNTLLFPDSCVVCEKLLKNPGDFCPNCAQEISFIRKPLCPVMGIPLPKICFDGAMSYQALFSPPPFYRARAAFQHIGKVKDLVHSFKYSDRLDLANFFVKYMIEAGSELINDCDIIIPVPLHSLRLLSRKYNQSAILAHLIAKSTGKIYAPMIVKRTVNTKPQASLSKAERLINVQNVFTCIEGRDNDIKGKNILIIDDVYTTGATVISLTKTLLKSRAKRVDILTISNAYKNSI